MLALLFAAKEFRCFLYGRKCTVYTDRRALKWLLNLQDPSSRLNRWAMKLAEYDFDVKQRPSTQMRYADALSRCVNAVEETVVLGREEVYEQQESDELCQRYKHYEDFWTDEEGMLYRQVNIKSPRIVIPRALVPVVLKHYHDSIFTAYQGVGRITEFIKRKYW